MAPYTKNDAILPLTELERIDEFLLSILFEILNIYAMAFLHKPADLYPALIMKIYNNQTHGIIIKIFENFTALLKKEDEELNNLIEVK